MSIKRTLIESGKWYKGNTHLHTTMPFAVKVKAEHGLR